MVCRAGKISYLMVIFLITLGKQHYLKQDKSAMQLQQSFFTVMVINWRKAGMYMEFITSELGSVSQICGKIGFHMI